MTGLMAGNIRRTTTWIALGMLLSSAAIAAETVNLSHLVVTIGGATGFTLAPVNLAATQSLCGDADGCQVQIALQGLSAAADGIGRFYLVDAGTGKWWTDADGSDGYFFDNDGAPGIIYSFNAFGHTCIFGDGNAEDAGLDSAPGFLLAISGSDVPNTTCTLSMSD